MTDFTIVYNDPFNRYEETPEIVEACRDVHMPGMRLSDGCIMKEDFNAVGEPTVTFEVGLADNFQALNEPPVLREDFSFMLGFVDAFKQGDYHRAGAHVKRLFDTVPSIKEETLSTNRGLVPRSETNAEKSFFDKIDLEAYAVSLNCDRVVFLNPNRGTINRYAESVRHSGFFKDPVAIEVLDNVDKDYYRRLAARCSEYGWQRPKVIGLHELDPRALYYASFGGGMSHMKHLHNYIGFRPSLVAMKLAGVEIMSATESGREFSYKRGREVNHVYVTKYGCEYLADQVTTWLNTSNRYVPAQGIFHDIVSSSVIPQIKNVIVPAPPYPLELEFVQGVRKYKKPYQIQGQWKQVQSMRAIRGRYVRSKHYANIYDLGHWVAANVASEGDAISFEHNGVSYVIEEDGEYIFRKHRNGNVKIDGHNYRSDIGFPTVDSIMEMISYNLRSMTIFRYNEEDVLGNVPIPITTAGEILGLDASEMNELIQGFKEEEVKEKEVLINMENLKPDDTNAEMVNEIVNEVKKLYEQGSLANLKGRLDLLIYRHAKHEMWSVLKYRLVELLLNLNCYSLADWIASDSYENDEDVELIAFDTENIWTPLTDLNSENWESNYFPDT